MRETEIAIAGGGLAGSLAAAMLGRAGYQVVLIDPHTAYPPDFRCEKLDGSQVAILRRTGLVEPVLRATTHDGQVWVARHGRVIERRASDQYGILYNDLVNTVRAEIPSGVERIQGKVTGITPSPGRQSVTLGSEDQILARLVILANGLNHGLRQALGMTRADLSPCHSITIGFDLRPTARASFDFRALTYYPERPSNRIAYLTVFPIGSGWRANLMTYRDMDDLWLRSFRQAPAETLIAELPGLTPLLGAFEVPGPVKIRPADLYQTEGYWQDGVVLVGDAFATSCPAAGTGTSKAFNDVERLCNHHVPRWMAGEEMSRETIATFYADPLKLACDKRSVEKAFRLRSLSIETGLGWRARRLARFSAGVARQTRAKATERSARWIRATIRLGGNVQKAT